VDRLQWQQFAERWLVDAKAMLSAHRWAAAYYVSGYAVECGLKACIMARLEIAPQVIFKDRKFSERCWTHSFLELFKLADLEDSFKADISADESLRNAWLIVKDWSELSRYEDASHQVAKRLYRAVTEKKSGVMSWIRAHW
jgi:HEPN domain-containing protein